MEGWTVACHGPAAPNEPQLPAPSTEIQRRSSMCRREISSRLNGRSQYFRTTVTTNNCRSLSMHYLSPFGINKIKIQKQNVQILTQINTVGSRHWGSEQICFCGKQDNIHHIVLHSFCQQGVECWL